MDQNTNSQYRDKYIGSKEHSHLLCNDKNENVANVGMHPRAYVPPSYQHSPSQHCFITNSFVTNKMAMDNDTHMQMDAGCNATKGGGSGDNSNADDNMGDCSKESAKDMETQMTNEFESIKYDMEYQAMRLDCIKYKFDKTYEKYSEKCNECKKFYDKKTKPSETLLSMKCKYESDLKKVTMEYKQFWKQKAAIVAHSGTTDDYKNDDDSASTTTSISHKKKDNENNNNNYKHNNNNNNNNKHDNNDEEYKEEHRMGDMNTTNYNDCAFKYGGALYDANLNKFQWKSTSADIDSSLETENSDSDSVVQAATIETDSIHSCDRVLTEWHTSENEENNKGINLRIFDPNDNDHDNDNIADRIDLTHLSNEQAIASSEYGVTHMSCCCNDATSYNESINEESFYIYDGGSTQNASCSIGYASEQNINEYWGDIYENWKEMKDDNEKIVSVCNIGTNQYGDNNDKSSESKQFIPHNGQSINNNDNGNVNHESGVNGNQLNENDANDPNIDGKDNKENEKEEIDGNDDLQCIVSIKISNYKGRDKQDMKDDLDFNHRLKKDCDYLMAQEYNKFINIISPEFVRVCGIAWSLNYHDLIMQFLICNYNNDDTFDYNKMKTIKDKIEHEYKGNENYTLDIDGNNSDNIVPTVRNHRYLVEWWNRNIDLFPGHCYASLQKMFLPIISSQSLLNQCNEDTLFATLYNQAPKSRESREFFDKINFTNKRWYKILSFVKFIIDPFDHFNEIGVCQNWWEIEETVDIKVIGILNGNKVDNVKAAISLSSEMRTFCERMVNYEISSICNDLALLAVACRVLDCKEDNLDPLVRLYGTVNDVNFQLLSNEVFGDGNTEVKFDARHYKCSYSETAENLLGECNLLKCNVNDISSNSIANIDEKVNDLIKSTNGGHYMYYQLVASNQVRDNVEARMQEWTDVELEKIQLEAAEHCHRATKRKEKQHEELHDSGNRIMSSHRDASDTLLIQETKEEERKEEEKALTRKQICNRNSRQKRKNKPKYKWAKSKHSLEIEAECCFFNIFAQNEDCINEWSKLKNEYKISNIIEWILDKRNTKVVYDYQEKLFDFGNKEYNFKVLAQNFRNSKYYEQIKDRNILLINENDLVNMKDYKNRNVATDLSIGKWNLLKQFAIIKSILQSMGNKDENRNDEKREEECKSSKVDDKNSDITIEKLLRWISYDCETRRKYLYACIALLYNCKNWILKKDAKSWNVQQLECEENYTKEYEILSDVYKNGTRLDGVIFGIYQLNNDLNGIRKYISNGLADKMMKQIVNCIDNINDNKIEMIEFYQIVKNESNNIKNEMTVNIIPSIMFVLNHDIDINSLTRESIGISDLCWQTIQNYLRGSGGSNGRIGIEMIGFYHADLVNEINKKHLRIVKTTTQDRIKDENNHGNKMNDKQRMLDGNGKPKSNIIVGPKQSVLKKQQNNTK